MNCQRCGVENADGAKFCSACGVELSAPHDDGPTHVAPAKDAGSRKPMRNLIVVAVVAIVIIAALAVIGLSWDALTESEPDSDGDGVPDSRDAAPNDPNLWNTASATVIVTIQSDHLLFSVDYSLYLNGVLKATGTLNAGSATTKTITHSFLTGITTTTAVVVLATSTGGGFGDESDQRTLTVANGGTYTVTLTI